MLRYRNRSSNASDLRQYPLPKWTSSPCKSCTTTSVIAGELDSVSNVNSVFNRCICELALCSYKTLLQVGRWWIGLWIFFIVLLSLMENFLPNLVDLDKLLEIVIRNLDGDVAVLLAKCFLLWGAGMIYVLMLWCSLSKGCLNIILPYMVRWALLASILSPKSISTLFFLQRVWEIWTWKLQLAFKRSVVLCVSFFLFFFINA